MLMNKKISSSLVFSLAIIIAAGIASISFNSNSAVFAVPVQYHAKLSGQQEVPPVTSSATGTAKFAPITKSVRYLLNATDITGVTGAHIHFAKSGQNGPVVVTLIKSAVSSNKVEQKGVITASMLEGPLKGKTITDLLTAMKKGNTYVNIHTIKHPNGEIRGDISFKKPVKHSTASSSSTTGKHSATTHSSTPKKTLGHLPGSLPY
jgi:hypothetical protein